MESGKQSHDSLQKCELCGKKMNPTINIYNENSRLCTPCFHHMKSFPETVAKGIERLLLGNVV